LIDAQDLFIKAGIFGCGYSAYSLMLVLRKIWTFGH